MTRLAAFAFTELAEGSATLATLGEARRDDSHGTYLEFVRTELASANGREVTVRGDSVMASFDSASDAVDFAIGLQRACDRHNSRRGCDRLDVRVGVEVGETHDGEPPRTARASPAAARQAMLLARAAEAGTIVASHLIPALADGAGARFNRVGLLDLEGVESPVPAFEVEWEPLPVSRPPMPVELAQPAGTPFVGRAPECRRLRELWDPTDCLRRLAFVVGEPGIGKTRLVAQFARHAYEHGAVVLWGRSFEEALTPYQPFVQALGHYVRNVSPQQLERQVGHDASALVRLVPELQGRVLRSVSAEPEEPESERYRLFEAVSHFLVAATAETPMLLVLDDLQWADPGTLLLLKHVARDPRPASLLLLGTYRQNEVGRAHALALVQADLGRDRVVEHVELDGLDEEEVAALLDALTGSQPPVDIVRSLYTETRGNPFFLEELVRHVQQSGLDDDSERLLQVEAAVRELGVPTRVKELVGRRLQRLSESARAALAAASVLGSEFGVDVLAAVLDCCDKRELVGVMDEAVEARLLVEVPEQLGRYGFAHALIQQTLYEDLTANRRATLHEQTASATERLHGDEPPAYAEIAYHYARAGEQFAAKVVHYSRAAGEHALALLAYEDAARDMKAALAALDRIAVDDRRTRAELLALLGAAQTRAGDTPAARASFRTAAKLAHAVDAAETVVKAALGFGGAAGVGGVWVTFAAVDHELVALLEQALAACPPTARGDRVRLLGRLAQALYWAPDRSRATALSDDALAAARRLGDRAALAYALDSRHVVLWGPDNVVECRGVAEEMLQLGRELHDRELQLEALAWLIADTLETDPIEVADGFIVEYGRLANELRQPYHLWYAEVTRAMRAHLEGRFAEATELSEHAFVYGRQAHGENAIQTHLVQSMLLKLDLGRVDDLIDELAQHAATSPLPAWRAALALALAGMDRREEALAEVERFAERGFESIARDCVWSTTMVALGRTVAHFDDPTSADELYELLLPFAERNCVVGGAVLCLGPISRILGMLARAAGRPEAALDHFAHALERSRALRSPPLVARTQLEAAKAHLARGGTKDVAEARRLLDEAGGLASEYGMDKLLHDIEALRTTAAGRAPVSGPAA